MKTICVFCGSSSGKSPYYLNEAKLLGLEIGQNNWRLVYGGASIGLMGVLADEATKAGSEVLGIIPKAILDKEVGNKNISELIVVEGMHQRKERMYSLSDAFLILPGGLGTLDETFEILTWAQLEYHQKPVYLLNSNGFFDTLLEYLNKASSEGFISDRHLRLLQVVKSIDEFSSSFKSC